MRGVGQTTHMIYTLPNERCLVVVSNASVGKSIKTAVEIIRGKNFAKNVKFVAISSIEDTNKLIGYSHLVFFDNSFFDSVEEEVARKALRHAESAAITYHTHKGNFK